MILTREADFGLKLADWLAADGYEVVMTHDMGEALEILMSTEPDIVLLDLHSPFASGLDTLCMIRMVRPQMPIITMADLTLHEQVVQSIKVGARAYLLKPFERYHACKLVNIQLRRSELLDPKTSHHSVSSVPSRLTGSRY